MRKISKKIMIFLVLMILSCTRVYAASKDCPVMSKSELMKKASMINVTYEEAVRYEDHYDYRFEMEMTEAIKYLNMKIYNVTDDFSITIKRDEAEGGYGKVWYVSYKDVGADGAITLARKVDTQIINYTIEIYGLNECDGEKIRSIRFTMPGKNLYSDLDVCKDIQDFYLCQPYITSNINPQLNVYELIDNYRASLDASPETEKRDRITNRNPASLILEKSSKAKYVFVGVILVIGIVITLIILKRRKSGNNEK